MRALWFLTLRSLVNSLRRTFQSPLRATLTAVVILWFVFVFVSNLLASLQRFRDHSATMLPFTPLLDTDYLIALLMGIHLTILWAPLVPWTGFRTLPLFTASDVNFLFSTPPRRLLVFLFPLFSRGLINSLLFLLILLIMVVSLGRDLIAAVFTGHLPSHVREVWVYPLMYVLTFVTLLMVGVLIALQEQRHEGFQNRVKWGLWGLTLVLATVVGWHAYQAWQRGDDPLQQVVWQLLHNPVVAIPLLPLRALAEAAIAPVLGWTTPIILGLVFWSASAAAAVGLLVRREHALYDLATQIATLSSMYAWRWQRPAHAAYEATLDAAQKRQQAVRWRLFDRWIPQGAWALLWCHSLLMLRLSSGLRAMGWVFIGALGGVIVALLRYPKATVSDRYILLMVTHYLLTLLLTFGVQGWLVSVLRRAEMNRSLPFRAPVVLLTEVLPPTLLVGLAQILFLLFEWALLPSYALVFLLHALIALSFVPNLLTGMLTVYLLFPDQTDYTQRALSGVLMLPALLIAVAPALIVLAISSILNSPLWLQTVLVTAVNLGTLWGAICLAGQQYGRVNLTE
jgi:hypothetical protein